MRNRKPLSFGRTLFWALLYCVLCIVFIILYFVCDHPVFMFVAGMQMSTMMSCIDEYFSNPPKEVSGDA